MKYSDINLAIHVVSTWVLLLGKILHTTNLNAKSGMGSISQPCLDLIHNIHVSC